MEFKKTMLESELYHTFADILIMRLFSSHSGFQSVLQHCTPNWFAVNMGTGITALCLASLPFSDFFLKSLARGIWILNTLLFIVFFAFWVSSLCLYPKIHVNLLRHSSLPFFLGCLPMGLTTVINGLVIFGVPLFGISVLPLAQGLWFFNALLAMLVVIVVPYCMFLYQEHELKTMTAVWLLPFVACEVAASSAGILAAAVPVGPAHTLILLGYILWGISLPLAFATIVILIQRIVFHSLPAQELGATIWLPLGPIGMGALGLLTLGKASDLLIQKGMTESWLYLAHPLGVIGAVILTGFSTWIFIMALLITLNYLRQGLKYNMTFWSFTFPLGVYTLSILWLGKMLDMSFFGYYGTVLTFGLLFFWMFVGGRTLPGLLRGNLIKNPIL